MSEQAKAWQQGWVATRKGSPASGNWGHRGRPGKRGGSLAGGGLGAMGLSSGASRDDIQQAKEAAEKKPEIQESQEHPGFVERESEQLVGSLPPAKRAPRYSGNDLSGAVRAAARMSLGHGIPFYVYRAFGRGYGITYRKGELSALNSFLKVMGRTVTKFVSKWAARQEQEDGQD